MKKKVFLRTFGCQMNDRDSEEIIGMLLERGYFLSDSPEDADVVLFNTCSVRKHAEDKAISNVGSLKTLKKKKPHVIIGITGCMAKAKKEELIKKLPHVDFVCGPANIYEIPRILEKLTSRRRPLLAVERESRPEIKNIAYHTKGISALVTIMEGCNNFCSYCIVPYVRGREVARPSQDILNEIKGLAGAGYKEVTLLGQNVNSYNDGGCDFVKLLEKINGIDGIERIRFLTSHPKDAGEDLFKAMRDLNKLCEHLHLPLQSGSDKILKSMNRRYSADEYLRKIGLLKKYVPGCSITTDIIVGYPGETEEDFKATKELMKKIGFNSAFIFKYSPRPPARASGLDDDVPKEVKKERNQALLRLQEEISSKKEKEFIGKEVEVLVEGRCRKERQKVTGRNSQNIKAVFEGKDDLIGKLNTAKIRSVIGHTLVGSLALFTIMFGQVFINEAKAQTAEEYFVSGDYESASREAGKLLSSAKDKEKAYYILGTSLNKLGRYELARQNFKFLIAEFPKGDYASMAQLGIADSYYLNSDYPNAGQEYERYITKYPKSQASAGAYFKLAKCAQKEGKWQAARNYYQKIKSDFPLSFEAQSADEALSEEIMYFTVQVGSFNKKANALKLCDELIKKNYDASILKAQSGGSETYKVRVGRLNTRDEAERLAKRLQADGLPMKVLP